MSLRFHPPARLPHESQRSFAGRDTGRLFSSLCLTLFLGAACGCQHFVVDDFAGAKLLMNLSGMTASAAGHHLELWARDSPTTDPASQDEVRILAGDGNRLPDGTVCPTAPDCVKAAYQIIPAVDLDDGCAIDDEGNLVTSPEYREHGAVQCPTTTTPDECAAAVVTRIHQLTDLAASPLYLLVAYDDQSAPRPSASAQAAESPPVTPDVRLTRCTAYWAASPWAYDGNPKQITDPIHGVQFGAIDFTSLNPPQLLGGITITTDYSLRDLRELWFTDTTATVDALDPNQLGCGQHADTCRGQVVLDSDGTTASEDEQGAIRLDLRSPDGAAVSGVVSAQVGLDLPSEQF